MVLPPSSRARRALALALTAAAALGSSACVEAGTYEKATSEIAELRRQSQQKDEQLRALQWQIAVVAQQLRDAQARSAAVERDLNAQVAQLSAANAALGEQMKRAEDERARLAAAADESLAAASKGGGSLRAEDVRRLLAAIEARNARVLEELARIERALANAHNEAAAAPGNKAAARPTTGDVVDPWGFGSRK
jgi:chromosome segregation ATPase